LGLRGGFETTSSPSGRLYPITSKDRVELPTRLSFGSMIYPISKICFLYSFHNKEQTARVKNKEVMRAITVIISANFFPSISNRNVPYMYLKIIKKKRINAAKKKGVQHQNIILAILFSL
jgi:hypothetical protein